MKPLRLTLLAIPAVLLAVLAWYDAAVAYWLNMGPVDAPGLLASDPRIALAKTDVEAPLQDGDDEEFWRPVPDAARAMLRAAPLEAMAVRQLGVATDILGKPGLSDYLTLAERLSRRDVLTQITLLRLSAEANDYRPSFMHLDTLLTVEPSAGTQFFLPMAKLLADPEARQELSRFGKRSWFSAFARTALSQTDDPADLAALLVSSRPVLPESQSTLLPQLLSRLVDTGQYPVARDLALRYGKASAAALDDFTLTRASADPRFAPLTWRTGATQSLQTGMTPDNVLEVDLSPGIAAVVADRITALAPGSYRLAQKMDGVDYDGDLLVGWELLCRQGTSAPRAWRRPLPMPKGSSRYTFLLEVPQDCPLQQWRLTALADESQADAVFRITSLQIRREP